MPKNFGADRLCLQVRSRDQRSARPLITSRYARASQYRTLNLYDKNAGASLLIRKFSALATRRITGFKSPAARRLDVNR